MTTNLLNEDIPYKYICPISNFIMLNPVIADDNQIYDNKSIKTWLENNDTSPLTREYITNNLIFNRDLCDEIFKYIIDHMRNNSPNINFLNKLIFELEDRKDEMFNIDLTSILKYKRDLVLSNNQDLEHSEFEKLFNKLFNGSFTIFNKQNTIYMLELIQDKIYDIDMAKTIFNTLPNDISGKIKLWNMKMTPNEYLNYMKDSDSDSESDGIDYEKEYNKRELLNEYNYSTKQNVLLILEKLKKKEYIYYNI